MKLSYLTATFLAIFSVLAYNNTAVTYPDGPPNDRCGLYGTRPTCTACHAANAGATNTLTIAGTPQVIHRANLHYGICHRRFAVWLRDSLYGLQVANAVLLPANSRHRNCQRQLFWVIALLF
ncbi:MAG: hypothetical protein IPN94_14885 [Sphingobacteriales bacterium]|nr:hypothetical protein [Sphingobacteriales bacterium]